jgi:hypothetical protein
MRQAIYGVITFVALGAAFYAGTYFPHASPTVSAAPEPKSEQTILPADAEIKRLQLDQLCAQSAETYAKENALTGIADQSELQHFYNSRLGKCLVMVSSFTKAGPAADSYAYTYISLNDAARGTDYGDFHGQVGPRGGPVRETVSLCSMFPDGRTLKSCATKDEWRAYVDSMMHD